MRVTMTKQLVSDLMVDALQMFDFRWKAKEDSVFMDTVAGALDLMGIIDKQMFMDRFTTTIGRTIYAPFQWTEGDAAELWNHVKTLVHELTHVRQHNADPVLFPARYLADRSWRAQYEAEAFTADLQMHFWMTGQVYDVNTRASVLLNYGLDNDHCNYVASHLASVAETIKDGGQVSYVATWACEWLENEIDDGA